MRNAGALADWELSKLLEGNIIQNGVSGNIQPASMDLRVSEEAYLVPGAVRPRCGESIKDMCIRVGGSRHDLNMPLMRGHVYLIRLEERLVHLPASVYGHANPKSTTGRLDIHVRVLSDGEPRYDTVSKGATGELWVLVSPNSFSVLVRPGYSLAQLRLFSQDTRLSALDLEVLHASQPILWNEDGPIARESLDLCDRSGALGMSIHMGHGLVGWEAMHPGDVIDITQKDHYDPTQFFRPVYSGSKGVTLLQGRFYILSTAERAKIPVEYACEMRPGDPRLGEVRVHYAGFIDPGWGAGKDGTGKGRHLTLEVRASENVIITPGEISAQIRLEKMSGTPNVSYDEQGTYVDQRLARLAKQFKAWPEE